MMRIKKWATYALLFGMVSSYASPALAAQGGHEVIHVKIGGSEVVFEDVAPVWHKTEQGQTVLLPVRAIAEALDWKLSWDPDKRQTTLTSGEKTLVLSANATQNPIAVQLQQGRMLADYTFVNALPGATVQLDVEQQIVQIEQAGLVQEPADRDEAVIDQLVAGQFAALVENTFDDSIRAQVPVQALADGWQSVTGDLGEYEGIVAWSTEKVDGIYDVNQVRIAYPTIEIPLTLTWNAEGRLIGLNMGKPTERFAKPIPEGITEETVVVGANSDYPLQGTLTLPAHIEKPLAAVVIVHGSGPGDRDGSAYAYKPYRDMAWGLAEQGIAVLRYDKRTLVYGQKLTPDQLVALTVKEETIDDAVLAADLLRADKRIDSDSIYVAGHSLGGMLAPRIEAAGGDFAGLAILAGSPRTLLEIIYDQNQAALAALDADSPEVAAQKALVAAEWEKAQHLSTWTKEQALAETLFGIPAYYFYEMNQYDAAELALKTDKPMLIMQGEDDFQVYADVDYVRWQEALAERDNVSYALYPNLNHFFIDYSGEGKGTVMEYQKPGVVDAKMINDLAKWVLGERN